MVLAAGLTGCLQGSAAADELSDLKTQLEELRQRVDVLDTPLPAAPGGHDTRAFITMVRGSGFAEDDPSAVNDDIPDDRGLTFLLSPAADMPVKNHELVVTGFVKGNLVYDFDQSLGDTFNLGNIGIGAGKVPRFRLYARHTRLIIKSKSETAVGRVRTYIEGDFFGGGGNQLLSNSDTFRVRHAWADWNITDNLNLKVGQTWSTFMSGFALPPSIDPRGPAGRAFIRQSQLRLTYRDGPWEFAAAVENPETDIQAGAVAGGGGPAGATCNESSGANPCGASDPLPDFTGHLFYKTTQNHKFQISGVLRDLHTDGDAAAAGFGGTDSTLGWGVLGAAAFDFNPLTFRVQATYGDGIGRYGSQYSGNRAAIAPDPAAIDLQTVEAFSLLASATFQVTDTSRITAAYGRVDFAGGDTLVGQNRWLQNVYVNWIYRPVSKLQFGWEVNWAERDVRGVGDEDAFRFGFATWFYF